MTGSTNPPRAEESDVVYLDNAATTPLDPRVLEAMMPHLTSSFANAASRQHALGCAAAQEVERARERIAAVIGADPREIVFTSGATESDNLAIRGVAASPVHRRGRDHVVTVVTEHRAVLDPCEALEREGLRVTWLGVDERGLVDLERLADAITDRTLLVSIMHANNETGVLQPIERIGALCRERGAVFHTDATQSVGKEAIDVDAACVDLLSASAHKVHGPKGVGFLYVRRRRPRVRVEPLLLGGGHERGMRSGTLNVPGIVGLAAACDLVADPTTREAEQSGIRRLRDRLYEGLASRIADARVLVGEVTLNGDVERRVAGIVNLSFPGVDGEKLMACMRDVAVSSASACTSATLQPSHVLGAHGLSEERIRGSVRFSLGRFTTEADIDRAIDSVADACARLRADAARGGSSEACPQADRDASGTREP